MQEPLHGIEQQKHRRAADKGRLRQRREALGLAVAERVVIIGRAQSQPHGK